MPIQPETPDREQRLLDLLRRVVEGRDVDWALEEFDRAAVLEASVRLRAVPEKAAESTATAAAPPEPVAPPPPPPPPARPRGELWIGDFRVVRKLGEGGMGVVYEAEQQHPRRPVALKVIRGGAHVSRDTLKLFQREAQTLARLRHPGIAALYATGATDDGLHYFAMELVRGSTLTAWIGQRPAGPMSPEELKLRMGVFKKICDAVAYAHQRGVIHRDLKPGNVLIPKTSSGSSFQDPVPEVKVLDFGLARITDGDLQATSYVTEMGRVQGTLPYMSPEQIRGNPDEIDLRTDVYSLGVLLYELVTGQLPYDLSRAQLAEAARIICEDPPRHLSATFSGTRRLDDDVITIAGKCLEKEAPRRYQSAAQLGDDVQRYLTDQPILARPPSATYQLRKLVARHKGAFASAAALFVLVATLAVSSTVQAIRIAQERDRANHEAETARQVSAFLEGLFKVSDPSEARGGNITAREILDAGAARIDRELADDQDTRARLLATMGETYLGLGMIEEAEDLLKRSLDATAESFGKDSVAYAKVLMGLGLCAAAKGDSRSALASARDAEARLAKLVPEGDPVRLKATWLLGISEILAGSTDDGIAHLEAGLRALDASDEPDDRLRIWFLNDLSWAGFARGDFDGARRSFERALEVRERVYPDELHPERINGLNNVAYMLVLQGDLERAIPMLERSVRQSEAVYGPQHFNLANNLQSLAEAYRRAGNLTAARTTIDRGIAIYERNGLRRSSGAVESLVTSARIREDAGQLPEATAGLHEVIDIVRRTLGEHHPAQIEAIEGLARVERRLGHEAAALEWEARAKDLRGRNGQTGYFPYSVSAPMARIE